MTQWVRQRDPTWQTHQLSPGPVTWGTCGHTCTPQIPGGWEGEGTVAPWRVLSPLSGEHTRLLGKRKENSGLNLSCSPRCHLLLLSFYPFSLNSEHKARNAAASMAGCATSDLPRAQNLSVSLMWESSFCPVERMQSNLFHKPSTERDKNNLLTKMRRQGPTFSV